MAQRKLPQPVHKGSHAVVSFFYCPFECHQPAYLRICRGTHAIRRFQTDEYRKREHSKEVSDISHPARFVAIFSRELQPVQKLDQQNEDWRATVYSGRDMSANGKLLWRERELAFVC